MIVDASVAFKWFAPEEGSDAAFALIGDEQLSAPAFLLIEVGNALWKKARREQIDPDISFEEDLAGLSAIVSLRDEAAIAPRALAMARTLDHPIYDCIHLAMAEAEDTRLVTADRRFADLVGASEWGHLITMLA